MRTVTWTCSRCGDIEVIDIYPDPWRPDAKEAVAELARAYDAGIAAEYARIKAAVERQPLGTLGLFTTDGETTTCVGDVWAYRDAILRIIDPAATCVAIPVTDPEHDGEHQ